MPNNRKQAMQRLIYLKERFKKDPAFFEDYKQFMSNLLVKGYARRMNDSPVGRTWHIPHHGVYHPSKPRKIRVVFDCSAGKSRNQELLTGLNLTNSIVGVLTRFRQGEVAFMVDIESMYYQVRVSEHQQSFIKFLWWDNHNIEEEPSDFAMCAHVFGGVSSASCSNYALKRTATDNADQYGQEAAEVVRSNFYVDDLLKSVDNPKTAMILVKNVVDMCKSGGFHLTKFISSNRELLISISEDQRRNGVKNADLIGDLPAEKALGIQRNIPDYSFTFNIQVNRRPLTKRKILSIISSIYDPLGLASPFVLEGRQLLQSLCNQLLLWDDVVGPVLRKDWERWEQKLKGVQDIHTSRCIKPHMFGKIVETSLHHFSDASEKEYGQCSYIRLVNDERKIHCSLLIGKSRVTPKKFLSTPRWELTAAVVFVKMACLIKKELNLGNITEKFWTDSQVVQKVFVANWVQNIQEHSDVNQCKYVKSRDNPADDASR